MIEPTPRPLPQRRLSQLVHGLRSRMSGGLQATALQVENLEKEIVAHGETLQTQQAEIEAAI